MAQTLARFTITKAIDDSFMLHIEDDSGATLELEASYDQLDLIVEAIDEQLSGDLDDRDEIEDDDDVKPDQD
ncbi:MAG: hypothetical protein ACKVOP_05205 [Sphingomonadaceae bacterium]